MHAEELERLAQEPLSTVEEPASSRSNTEQGLIKDLADEILVSDDFARDLGGALYRFERGSYRPYGEIRIAQRVKHILIGNGDAKRWSTHRAREVTEFIRVDAPLLWERPPLDILNLSNGLLDLSTRTLHSHDPSHLSPIQLPVAYDPGATCPVWQTFIERVLPSDCQALPYELAGASMRGDVSDQKAVLLIGSGENGKSTLLKGLVAFLGGENVTNITLQKLEVDKFAAVRLLGKLSNICADLPSDHLTTTSVFKALTGGDRLTAERKFQNSFEFVPFARLLFSANHHPQSKDSSEAFFRRWLVIPFDTVIKPQEKDPAFPDRLATASELSGVLNRAIAALPALQHRGGFSQSESTVAAAMEFREMTDPVATWIDRYTALAPEGMVTKKDVLIAYNGAAEVDGRPPMSSKAFYAGVKRLRPTIQEAQRSIRGSVQWVFLGLEIKGSASQHSRLSQLSSEISLGVERKREERDIDLNKGNAVNAVNGVSQDTTKPCGACQGSRFWKSVHGSVVCVICHPPLRTDLVAEWINGDFIETGDKATVNRQLGT